MRSSEPADRAPFAIVASRPSSTVALLRRMDVPGTELLSLGAMKSNLPLLVVTLVLADCSSPPSEGTNIIKNDWAGLPLSRNLRPL